jgi:hypothetical protein
VWARSPLCCAGDGQYSDGLSLYAACGLMLSASMKGGNDKKKLLAVKKLFDKRINRSDSVQECRLCLEPGIERRCCGNYYCNICYCTCRVGVCWQWGVLVARLCRRTCRQVFDVPELSCKGGTG